jgi:hypothetical protein
MTACQSATPKAKSSFLTWFASLRILAWKGPATTARLQHTRHDALPRYLVIICSAALRLILIISIGCSRMVWLWLVGLLTDGGLVRFSYLPYLPYLTIPPTLIVIKSTTNQSQIKPKVSIDNTRSKNKKRK